MPRATNTILLYCPSGVKEEIYDAADQLGMSVSALIRLSFYDFQARQKL